LIYIKPVLKLFSHLSVIFFFVLRNLLKFADGTTKWNLPNPGVGTHNIMVQLPDDISCTQCVLQWRYRTG